MAVIPTKIPWRAIVAGADDAALVTLNGHGHAQPSFGEQAKREAMSAFDRAPGDVPEGWKPEGTERYTPSQFHHSSDIMRRLDSGVSNLEWGVGKIGMGAFIAPVVLSIGGGGMARVGGFGVHHGVPGFSLLKRTGELMQGSVNWATKTPISTLVPSSGPLGKVGGMISNSIAGAAAVFAKGAEATGIPHMMANSWEKKIAPFTVAREMAVQNMLAFAPKHPDVEKSLSALKAQLDIHPFDLKVHEFREVVDEAVSTAKAKGQKDLAKSIKKLSKANLKLHDAHYMEEGWRNLSGNIRKAPATLGRTPVMNAVVNTTIMTGIATSSYFTARGAVASLETLKEMYSDITGIHPDDVSGYKLLFGSIPEQLSPVRYEIYKEFGPAVILDAANFVVNLNMMMRSSASLLLAIVMGGASMLAKSVLHGTLVPAYDAIKDAQKHHAPVTPDLYAKFIGDAAPELRELGGPESHLTQLLAQEYAARQVTPKQIFEDIKNGVIKKRAEEMKQQNEQVIVHPGTLLPPVPVENKKESQPPMPANIDTQFPTQQDYSHVQALKQGKLPIKIPEIINSPREVHGRFSGDYVASLNSASGNKPEFALRK